MSSDDTADVVLNVYNLNLVPAAQVSYFQSATGTGWLPSNLGSIFDTPALRLADSFVTVGGFAQDTLLPEQAPGAGSGTGLDPNFGGNSAIYPGENAGWFTAARRTSTARSARSPTAAVASASASSSAASPTTATST